MQTHGKQELWPLSIAASLIQVSVFLLIPCSLMHFAIAGANLIPQEMHDDDDPENGLIF